MAIRYYPISKIKTNLKATGNEFLLDGKPYVGQYYTTFDGTSYTGANPITGKNQLLTNVSSTTSAINLSNSKQNSYYAKSKISPLDIEIPGKVINIPPPQFKGAPTSYFPTVAKSDYDKGYLVRCFIKKTNSNGYVIEISPEEYTAVKNGMVPYDVSFFLTYQIFWKLTGPLRTVRVSQYQTRVGIIDTNQRLVEEGEKTFIGIKDFIGGDYSKFASPTQ